MILSFVDVDQAHLQTLNLSKGGVCSLITTEKSSVTSCSSIWR